MNIIQFEWNNAKGEDHAGNHLIIGQHLPNREDSDITHIELVGISIDIMDNMKDDPLPHLSCYRENKVGNATSLTKEEARKLAIKHIDEALEFLFSDAEIKARNESMNKVQEEDEEDY